VPFIAHPTSHAWFHESKILWQQQDVMLKVQALWNDVAIVSAGNMAYGALYTKAGKKIQPTPVKTGESWQVSLVRW
jgi:apolipoprotein N-acyltransferase